VDATAAWDDAQAESIPIDAIGLDFTEFYAATRDQVVRALSLTLGDSDLAADATDEALARAYLKWAIVSRLDNPGGWVFRVGLNWARSSLRRRHRPARRLGDADSLDLPPVVEPALMAALAGLSVRHRSVVVCRYLLGYSDEETANALALRPGTVRSCLHRALKRLRADLGHLREENN
jgi:DNA-directed RNA polymerase specialized sigma24 family protein